MTRVHVIQISYSEMQLSCCLFQHDETGLLKSKKCQDVTGSASCQDCRVAEQLSETDSIIGNKKNHTKNKTTLNSDCVAESQALWGHLSPARCHHCPQPGALGKLPGTIHHSPIYYIPTKPTSCKASNFKKKHR